MTNKLIYPKYNPSDLISFEALFARKARKAATSLTLGIVILLTYNVLDSLFDFEPSEYTGLVTLVALFFFVSSIWRGIDAATLFLLIKKRANGDSK